MEWTVSYFFFNKLLSQCVPIRADQPNEGTVSNFFFNKLLSQCMLIRNDMVLVVHASGGFLHILCSVHCILCS